MEIPCSVNEPAALTFFDSANQIGLNFVAPIFMVKGFTIDMIAIDVMHVVDLGISQYLCGAVFSVCVEGNFAGSTANLKILRQKDNIFHLRRRLRSYYIANAVLFQRGNMSKLFRITAKMLGKPSNPRLHCKAAECRQLIKLLPDLCRENASLFQGSLAMYLPHCCVQMRRFHQIIESNPRQLSQSAQRDLEDTAFAFVHFWKKAGGHNAHKHH
eukprot:9473511-Pyramimonas_sp.AAC.1